MFSRLFVPDTLDYMIAGYVVLSVMILIYISSLAMRWKKARQEYENLKANE